MDKIKYIGPASPWRDDLTGSGLTWTTGQEANVADHVGNVARGYTSHFQMVDDGVKVTADSSGALYRDDTQSPVSGGGIGLPWLRDWLLRRDLRIDLDPLMSSPPTIEVQAGAFAGITKAWPATVTDNGFWAGVMDFSGGFMARATNRIKPRVATATPATATNPLVTTGWDDCLSGGEFFCDADVIVLHINTSSANPWRFLIDEFDGLGPRYTSLTGHVAFQTGDSYMRMTFASAKPRRIIIEGPTSWAFSRVFTTAVYTVWAEQRRIPRISLIHDSFSVGPVAGPPAQYTSPAPINQDGYANHVKRLLDADVWVSGIGGTGWGQEFSGKPSFNGRWYDALNLMPDGATPRSNWAPDLIWVPGSYNSNGLDTAVITAAMQSFYNNIRERNKTIPIVFSGPIQRPSDSATGLSQARDAAMAAWAAGIMAADKRVGYYAVTTADAKWWAGAGYQGATTGAGNTDVQVGTDGAHPSYVGHRILARRHAAGLVQAMAGMS